MGHFRRLNTLPSIPFFHVLFVGESAELDNVFLLASLLAIYIFLIIYWSTWGRETLGVVAD